MFLGESLQGEQGFELLLIEVDSRLEQPSTMYTADHGGFLAHPGPRGAMACPGGKHGRDSEEGATQNSEFSSSRTLTTGNADHLQ